MKTEKKYDLVIQIGMGRKDVVCFDANGLDFDFMAEVIQANLKKHSGRKLILTIKENGK